MSQSKQFSLKTKGNSILDCHLLGFIALVIIIFYFRNL